MPETAVHSFVVRFVQEELADVGWRGFVRHVQSSEEMNFTQIQEAIAFMGQFVSLEQATDEDLGRDPSAI